MSLNGSSKIPLTNLNTSSMENPTILKGRSKSQMIGNSKTINKATGQQRIKRIHQSINAINVLMI
jgi:hypothetical protein